MEEIFHCSNTHLHTAGHPREHWWSTNDNQYMYLLDFLIHSSSYFQQMKVGMRYHAGTLGLLQG